MARGDILNTFLQTKSYQRSVFVKCVYGAAQNCFMFPASRVYQLSLLDAAEKAGGALQHRGCEIHHRETYMTCQHWGAEITVELRAWGLFWFPERNEPMCLPVEAKNHISRIPNIFRTMNFLQTQMTAIINLSKLIKVNELRKIQWHGSLIISKNPLNISRELHICSIPVTSTTASKRSWGRNLF